MRLFLAVFLFIVLPVKLIFSQDINAVTDDGKEVILKSDGTWIFVHESSDSTFESITVFTKPENSKSILKTKKDKYFIWYDNSKWNQNESEDVNRYELSHVDGDVGALIIAERIQLSIDNLKAIVLENAQSAAYDAKIVYEEKRIVNGKEILFLKLEGTIQGISFVYNGYYYVGEGSVIQLLTYTSKHLYSEYESDMIDLLNGLIAND